MELEKVLEGIQQHRDSLHKGHKWNDPVSLSDTATKLATYNSYLADYLAPLHREATDASARAYRKEKAEGSATNQAEAEARYRSTGEREAFENVQFIYKATDKLINVIQTRLRVIENQIKTEGKQ